MAYKLHRNLMFDRDHPFERFFPRYWCRCMLICMHFSGSESCSSMLSCSVMSLAYSAYSSRQLAIPWVVLCFTRHGPMSRSWVFLTLNIATMESVIFNVISIIITNITSVVVGCSSFEI